MADDALDGFAAFRPCLVGFPKQTVHPTMYAVLVFSGLSREILEQHMPLFHTTNFPFYHSFQLRESYICSAGKQERKIDCRCDADQL